MGWFNDLGIRWKLLGGFGALLAALLAVGGLGLRQFLAAGAATERVAGVEMAAVETALDAQVQLLTMQRELRQALLVDGEEARRAWQATFKTAEERLTADLARLNELLAGSAEAGRLEALRAAYDAWTPTRSKAFELAVQGDIAGSKQVLFGAENVRAYNAVNNAIGDLVQAKRARAAAVVADTKAAARRTQVVMAIVMAVAVAVGAGIALVVSRRITRGVQLVGTMLSSLADHCVTSLARGLEAFARGDLTVHVEPVTQPIAWRGRDELGRMAETANTLLDRTRATVASYEQARTNLQAEIGRVREAAESVASTGAQLGQAAAQTSEGVGQVSNAMTGIATGAQETATNIRSVRDTIRELVRVIDQVARGATEQAGQVQATTATANEMATSIEQMAANAANAAAAVEQSKASAERGAAAVREAVEGLKVIAAEMREATALVKELGSLGERIGVVVETIDDIADQTNLLALNAAIEAARAGEHGRGFAVVADEVRKLAERSQRETKTIADLIAQVRTATGSAVAAIDRGAAVVETGAAQADRAEVALAEILQAVEVSAEQVRQIASGTQQTAAGARNVVAAMESVASVVEENTAATEEMAAQAEQVTRAVDDIAAITEENSAAAEQVTASAEEISAQVEEMTAQAEELAATASELRALVGRFTVERTDGLRVVSQASPPDALRRAA
jgi:methyl-accepting chemotaxis protein